eukprot:SAG22_NODE_150_length_17426_cov_8.082588_16_plen_208_part_00
MRLALAVRDVLAPQAIRTTPWAAPPLALQARLARRRMISSAAGGGAGDHAGAGAGSAQDAPPAPFAGLLPHQILGVAEHAELHTVKAVFRRQVMVLHPDKVLGGPDKKEEARERFNALVDAFERLCSHEQDPAYREQRSSNQWLSAELDWARNQLTAKRSRVLVDPAAPPPPRGGGRRRPPPAVGSWLPAAGGSCCQETGSRNPGSK